MFYAHFVLSKKGPLARIWLAAHWDKKLTKAHVFETNIEGSVEAIIQPKMKLALRTSGHLLLGVVRIYSRKAKYLLADCNEAFVKIKMAFRPGVVDLPEENREAAMSAITLAEAFHEFDTTMADLNDIDVHAQFAVNQSRPEEITMREELGNITLVGDDGFGDMGFDGASAMMHDSQMDDALYLKPSDPTRLSGEGSTVGMDFDIPGRDDAFASGLDDYDGPAGADDDDDDDGGSFGGGELFGDNFVGESGGLFEDPMTISDLPMDQSDPFRSSNDPFRMTNDPFRPAIDPFRSVNDQFRPANDPFQTANDPFRTNNDPFRTSDDTFAPNADASGTAASAASAEPAAAAAAMQPTSEDDGDTSAAAGAPPSLDLAVPDGETAAMAARLREAEMDEQMSNLAAAVLSNKPSYMSEPLPPQPDVQNAFITEEAAAVLMSEDPETFALEPIDINTMGTERKIRKKRKLIIDDQKAIASETMKLQLSDSSDIVTTLDLAPPTKKLMHWKETGGVEKLFAFPGRQIVCKNISRLFSLNLVTKSGTENPEIIEQSAAAAAISHAAEIERARAADEQDARERMLAIRDMPRLPLATRDAFRAPTAEAPSIIDESTSDVSSRISLAPPDLTMGAEMPLYPWGAPGGMTPAGGDTTATSGRTPRGGRTPGFGEMTPHHLTPLTPLGSRTPAFGEQTPRHLPHLTPLGSRTPGFGEQTPHHLPQLSPAHVLDTSLPVLPSYPPYLGGGGSDDEDDGGGYHGDDDDGDDDTIGETRAAGEERLRDVTSLEGNNDHTRGDNNTSFNDSGSVRGNTLLDDTVCEDPTGGEDDGGGGDEDEDMETTDVEQEDAVVEPVEGEAAEQAEERRWNKRSQQMLGVLNRMLHRQDTVSFQEIVTRNNRKQAASKFYTFLVMKKLQAIDVKQPQPFGDITISKGPAFSSIL